MILVQMVLRHFEAVQAVDFLDEMVKEEAVGAHVDVGQYDGAGWSSGMVLSRSRPPQPDA